MDYFRPGSALFLAGEWIISGRGVHCLFLDGEWIISGRKEYCYGLGSASVVSSWGLHFLRHKSSLFQARESTSAGWGRGVLYCSRLGKDFFRGQIQSP